MNFKFRAVDILGAGASGKVLLVQKVATGDVFAMKLIRKSEAKAARQERDHLMALSSAFITSLLFSYETSMYICLVLEYAPGGNLRSILSELRTFDEDMARFYVAEMALALNHVHSCKLIHCDVKPENVLIGGDGHIKLTVQYHVLLNILVTALIGLWVCCFIRSAKRSNKQRDSRLYDTRAHFSTTK